MGRRNHIYDDDNNVNTTVHFMNEDDDNGTVGSGRNPFDPKMAYNELLMTTEKKLKEQQDSHKAEIKALKESHEKEIASLKDSFSKDTKSLKDDLATVKRDLANADVSEIADLKAKIESMEQELKKISIATSDYEAANPRFRKFDKFYEVKLENGTSIKSKEPGIATIAADTEEPNKKHTEVCRYFWLDPKTGMASDTPLTDKQMRNLGIII